MINPQTLLSTVYCGTTFSQTNSPFENQPDSFSECVSAHLFYVHFANEKHPEVETLETTKRRGNKVQWKQTDTNVTQASTPLNEWKIAPD